MSGRLRPGCGNGHGEIWTGKEILKPTQGREGGLQLKHGNGSTVGALAPEPPVVGQKWDKGAGAQKYVLDPVLRLMWASKWRFKVTVLLSFQSVQMGAIIWGVFLRHASSSPKMQ